MLSEMQCCEECRSAGVRHLRLQKQKAAKMQRAKRSNACSFGVELRFSVYVKLQINSRQC